MKNREVKAMLLAMAFSTVTMTSCGVYGSMEPSKEEPIDVYGPPEYYENELPDDEIAAVYGPVEYFDSEYYDSENADLYDENLSASERWSEWECIKESRNGYDEATNREVEFDGVTFEIPEYMQEEESENEDDLSFLLEESDTDLARLTLHHETREIPTGDGDYIQLLDGIISECSEDDRTANMEDIEGPDGTFSIVTTYEIINGEIVITQTAYYIRPISDTEADLLTLTFTNTGGCEYSYAEDLEQIIANSR